MRIFQYAVLLHPTDKEKKEGGRTKIIVEVTTIVAKDEGEAGMRAAREIADEYTDKLDRVEVAVRPF